MPENSAVETCNVCLQVKLFLLQCWTALFSIYKSNVTQSICVTCCAAPFCVNVYFAESRQNPLWNPKVELLLISPLIRSKFSLRQCDLLKLIKRRIYSVRDSVLILILSTGALCGARWDEVGECTKKCFASLATRWPNEKWLPFEIEMTVSDEIYILEVFDVSDSNKFYLEAARSLWIAVNLKRVGFWSRFPREPT